MVYFPPTRETGPEPSHLYKVINVFEAFQPHHDSILAATRLQAQPAFEPKVHQMHRPDVSLGMGRRWEIGNQVHHDESTTIAISGNCDRRSLQLLVNLVGPKALGTINTAAQADPGF